MSSKSTSSDIKDNNHCSIYCRCYCHFKNCCGCMKSIGEHAKGCTCDCHLHTKCKCKCSCTRLRKPKPTSQLCPKHSKLAPGQRRWGESYGETGNPPCRCCPKHNICQTCNICTSYTSNQDDTYTNANCNHCLHEKYMKLHDYFEPDDSEQDDSEQDGSEKDVNKQDDSDSDSDSYLGFF